MANPHIKINVFEMLVDACSAQLAQAGHMRRSTGTFSVIRAYIKERNRQVERFGDARMITTARNALVHTTGSAGRFLA